MKNIVPYKTYLEESVRDRMTPIPSEKMDELISDNLHGSLMKAIEIGDVDLAETIIKKGADVHEYTEEALRKAAHLEDGGMIEMLLRNGANAREAIRFHKFINGDNYGFVIEEIKWWSDYVKHNQNTNESLRDKMTPKSGEELEQVINKLLDKYPKPTGDNKYMVISNDIWRDGKTYWVDRSNGQVSYEEALKIKSTHETQGLEKGETITIMLWEEFIDMVKDKIRKNIKLDESIRDKMTPKSPESYQGAIVKLMNKDKSRGYFNPTEWGLVFDEYYQNYSEDSTTVFYFHSLDGRKWIITLCDARRWFSDVDYKYYFGRIRVRERKRGETEKMMDTYEEMEKYLSKRGLTKRVNEGIRDKMTPKSDEDMLSAMSGMTQGELDKWLHKSVIRKDTDMIRLLISAGADLDLGLLYAITGTITTKPDLDIVRLLLDMGADPMKPGKRSGVVPMRHAIHWNPGPLVELLQQYVKVYEGIRNKMTPKSKEDVKSSLSSLSTERLYDMLVRSITGNDIETLEMVLPHVDISQDEYDLCELAVELGHMGVLALLVGKGLSRENQKLLLGYISVKFERGPHYNMWTGIVNKYGKVRE